MKGEATFEKRSISVDLARRMIAAAEAKAAETGIRISTTIVDESGLVKAFSRMDGAPIMSIGVSQKKAQTAVGFGMPTGEPWYEFIKNDPILMNGAPSIDQFILLGGGFPIRVGDTLIGAIGVSGAHYEQDSVCARAALSLIG